MLDNKINTFELHFALHEESNIYCKHAVFLGGYLSISKPEMIVISTSGNVEGLANKTRAAIYGKRFWNQQLRMANEE